MSTFSGLDGVWYLSKVGTVGLSLPLAPAAPGMIDAAGTKIGKPQAAASTKPEQKKLAGRKA
jgi:hypothetical protein